MENNYRRRTDRPPDNAYERDPRYNRALNRQDDLQDQDEPFDDFEDILDEPPLDSRKPPYMRSERDCGVTTRPRQGNVPERNRQRNSQSNGNASASSKSKLLRTVFLLLLIVNVLFFFSYWAYNKYSVIGRFPAGFTIESIDTTELDLRGSKVDSFSGIERLTNLKTLDVRGCDLTAETYTELRSLVPSNCDISWSIPIGAKRFDSDSTVVSFSDARPGELAMLEYFEHLERVSAKGCKQYDELYNLYRLKPNCEFEWSLPFCGNEYSSNTAELKISDSITREDADMLRLFPKLTYVDASACTQYDLLLELNRLMPTCEFLWRIDLCGADVSSTAKEVNLNGTRISDLDSFSSELELLPKLERLYMDGCGLSDSQLGELQNRFPDRKFVWTIKFGDDQFNWSVRTDTTIFSTLNGSGGTKCTEKTFAPLFLYCKDLVAIDLGHNEIVDISLISNLKKLKVIILGDNKISDLTPLTQLPELEYLEMWLNEISDLRPLSSIQTLKDIDLSNNHVSDLTPLYSLTNLESLLLANSISEDMNVLTYSQLHQLSQALPGCLIDRYHSDGASYFKNNERYKGMKLAFTYYKKVIRFGGWNDVEYVSGFYK